MIPIAVSQRVDCHPDRGERRDALDQRWPLFLAACGLLPVVLPNRPELVVPLLDRTAPAGLLLTGGNDLAVMGGDAPERDETEARAVAWARRHGRPVLGVCRGMQMLAHLCGGSLRRVAGHVAVEHALDGGRVVNSYHGWAVDMLPDGFQVTQRAADGVVEAFRHAAQPIAGLMWHPERVAPFDALDITLFREFFA